ncbi:sensor domain-containing protein, partial [Nocardiopsis sp. TSRI0078]|uniref:sensor domain-containing protein n=2 Tax=unclassified Nocardiopsis TaxID=2649073 RepID=UPI000AAD2B49
MATAPHRRAGRLTTLAYLFLLLSQNIAALLLLPLIITSAILTLIWIGLPFVILTGTLLRTLAHSQRRTLAHLLPTAPLPSAYRPIPPAGITRRGATIITDPATWKDLLWLISGAANIALIALPATLLLHGTYQLLFALHLLGPTLYGFYTPTTTPHQLLI